MGRGKASEDVPLHLLRTFGDRVIENYSSAQPLDKAGITPPPGAVARQQTVDGELYFLFTRDISGYGDLPITIGAYFLARAVDAPLRLFYWASIIALVMLGASLIAAALMAGTISGPIRRAARGAAAIGTLDFDKVAPLEHSRFREINDLAHSFNAMLDGLRAFGRYVPRTLVTRLVKEGRVGAGTEERKLAIMFTDIVGFTAACEKLTAREVAEYINHHLALVAACVEQEGGTIDKFIGDAVMAFWGAPGRVENPAASACRAAVAIQLEIAAENQRRTAAGLEPVRIRIGIHMGTVVVGDIGAPNRINYTIVGDAVNATQRLESLGKSIDPDAELITLVSREVFKALPDGFHLVSRGSHLVKGKHDGLDVYQLVGRPKGAAGDTDLNSLRGWRHLPCTARDSRVPDHVPDLPRPRRAAQRLRRLAEGADEGAAHPLRIAKAGGFARRARSPRWRTARAAAPPRCATAPPPSTAWCRSPP